MIHVIICKSQSKKKKLNELNGIADILSVVLQVLLLNQIIIHCLSPLLYVPAFDKHYSVISGPYIMVCHKSYNSSSSSKKPQSWRVMG